jgi:hypothetical protein
MLTRQLVADWSGKLGVFYAMPTSALNPCLLRTIQAQAEECCIQSALYASIHATGRLQFKCFFAGSGEKLLQGAVQMVA